MVDNNYDFNKKNDTLEKQIGCVKYTLFCFNIVCWMFGAALFGITAWIRAQGSFDEWISILKIQVYYTGIYILLATSIIIMAICFLGCVSALMETSFALMLFVISQVISFILVTAGSAVLLDFSTVNSSIQPIIKDSMTRLIMSSEHPLSSVTLKMIQENVGCCGADGANDYILLRQPLPMECRDTVSGNAFFHGCVDELTWFLEDKSGWIAAISMCIAFINVINAVMSLILIQAIKKEEDDNKSYRN